MGPPSSTTSPRFNNATPVRGSPSIFRPKDRSLPSRDVAASIIADAYISFILYCNPQFPLSVDTATLRTSFASPPKSDGKDFETFNLWELLKQLDAKEIKTWGELAIKLGVEPPDVSKGQSVQKVQQYSVRLKRWMRAMHIDAFFEYLLGKQHAYFTDVPPPNDPYPADGRDGVKSEEDLAIRALDPSFRPKRGRRRNSDAEHDAAIEDEPPSKLARLSGECQPTSGYPHSAVPMSAHPNSQQQQQQQDPWAAASAITNQSFAHWPSAQLSAQSAITPSTHQQLRWQNSQTPATPHPLTSHTSTNMSSHIDAAFAEEPKSAITPSTGGRRRRKHGPAVSSAWPSAGKDGGKPRGRPPASRNVRDGPFSTFPVDPGAERQGQTNSAPAGPIMSESPVSLDGASQSQMPPPAQGKPKGRLSLQVPNLPGGPVRLATPPAVFINGDPKSNDTDTRSDTHTPEPMLAATSRPPKQRVIGSMQITDREMPGFAFEALKRVLTSDLLRAELIGRRQRLTGDEAKRLADSVLERLNVPRADTSGSRDDITRLTAASWLGLGDQLNVPLGPAVGQTKRITVTRFRTDSEGYEEIVSANAECHPEDDINEVFDLTWTVTLSGCSGSFDMRGLLLSAPEPVESGDLHDVVLAKVLEASRIVGADDQTLLQRAKLNGTKDHGFDLPQMQGQTLGRLGGDGVDWKAKYMALEFGAKIAQGEMSRIRGHLLERVLDVLL